MIAMWGKEKAKIYITQNVSNIHKTTPYQFKGLVTNYGEGGATKREGGAREVLPLRKGGAEKVLAMLKGGTKSFGVVFTW